MMKVYTYNPATGKMEWNPNGANKVSFTPSGNIVATNVQDAIEELDSEKAGIDTANTFSEQQQFTLMPQVGSANLQSAGTSNGQTWMRFKNGLQMVWGRGTSTGCTTASGSVYRSAVIGISYVIPFAATPVLLINAEYGNRWGSTTGASSTTGGQVVIFSTANDASAHSWTWMCIGPWA